MPSSAAIENPKSKIENLKALGVILSQFPRYDEAFILRELSALAQGGRPLVIFSLRSCRDRVVHEQAKRLLPNTVYSPFCWSGRLWRSHGMFLRQDAGTYFGALGWIVSRHWAHPVMLLKTLAFFPKAVRFAALARERGVAHLHAFWATYPASCALLMSRLTGIPYSLSGHAHDIYTTSPSLAEKMRGATFVVTCTQANKRYLEKLMDSGVSSPVPQCAGLPVDGFTGQPANPPARQPANIVVSYHGVDLSRFTPTPNGHGANRICRILSVGSLLPCKGFETLIEGCAQLQARGMSFHCTIAGGGPLERRLRRLIARYGIGQHVEITGFLSQDALIQRYQAADLFVLPLVSKIHWGIPNVVIEAMATKTPVLCCNLPSLAELIEHGRSGWIIPEGDPAELAEAVETLWQDKALRVQLAEAGYERIVEHFSLEQTGARLRRLFAGSPVGRFAS